MILETIREHGGELPPISVKGASQQMSILATSSTDTYYSVEPNRFAPAALLQVGIESTGIELALQLFKYYVKGDTDSNLLTPSGLSKKSAIRAAKSQCGQQ